MSTKVTSIITQIEVVFNGIMISIKNIERDKKSDLTIKILENGDWLEPTGPAHKFIVEEFKKSPLFHELAIDYSFLK